MKWRIRSVGFLVLAVSLTLLYGILRVVYQTSGLFGVASVPVGSVLLIWISQAKQPTRKDVLDIAGLLLNFFVTVIIFLWIFLNGSLFGDWARSYPWFFLLGTVAVGYLFYVYRRHLQLFYGVTEIVFGLLLLVQVFLALQQAGVRLQEDDVFKLFGGLYVVVRGLDNMEKGASRRGPLVQYVMRLAYWDAESWSQFWRSLKP